MDSKFNIMLDNLSLLRNVKSAFVTKITSIFFYMSAFLLPPLAIQILNLLKFCGFVEL